MPWCSRVRWKTLAMSATRSAYAAARYLRTGRCQVMARIYGGFYHAKGVTRELATGFLQSRTVENSFESLAWLYDYDPFGAARE